MKKGTTGKIFSWIMVGLMINLCIFSMFFCIGIMAKDKGIIGLYNKYVPAEKYQVIIKSDGDISFRRDLPNPLDITAPADNATAENQVAGILQPVKKGDFIEMKDGSVIYISRKIDNSTVDYSTHLNVSAKREIPLSALRKYALRIISQDEPMAWNRAAKKFFAGKNML